MALKGPSSLRKGPSFGPVSPWNIFCPLWIMFFSFFLEIGWGRKETEVRLLALPCGSGCTCWWRVGARFLGPHLQTLIWCPHSTTWQFSLFFKWYSLLCWYILLGRWGFWLCSPPHNFSPLTEATGGPGQPSLSSLLLLVLLMLELVPGSFQGSTLTNVLWHHRTNIWDDNCQWQHIWNGCCYK